MRNGGAAKRQREPEQPDEPDPAAAIAALTRLSAAMGDLIARVNRQDAEIAAACAALSAGDLAELGGRIASRQDLQLTETISLAAHWAEAREVLEGVGPQLAALYLAGVEAGRRIEAADRDALSPPARGPRHARKHLKPVPGIGSAAARTAVAAGIVAAISGGAVAMHEESAVRVVASAPAAATGVHRMPPDTAVLLPTSAPLPSETYQAKHARKPSADAATATPAPSPSSSLPVLASPSPSVPSVPPPAAVSSGTVNLQTVNLVIGPSGQARIVFTASGTVQWSAQASGPVSLSRYGGLLGDGQSAVIVVTVQPGTAAGSATVTITDQDGNATQVPVTWVALPVL